MISTPTLLKQLKELKKHTHSKRLASKGWDEEWKVIISTLLSAQNRDSVTIPVASNLFKRYKNLKILSSARLKDVEKIISSLNYYKTKAKHVISCAKLLYSWNEIPRSIEKLIELPGVGRKTANVFLSELGIPSIAVDTHVARISKKLGWTNNSNVKKIEFDLMEGFPKKNWVEINEVLVRFGQNRKRSEQDEIIKTILKL